MPEGTLLPQEGNGWGVGGGGGRKVDLWEAAEPKGMLGRHGVPKGSWGTNELGEEVRF